MGSQRQRLKHQLHIRPILDIIHLQRLQRNGKREHAHQSRHMRRHVLQGDDQRREALPPRVHTHIRPVPRKLPRALVPRPRLRRDLERIEDGHIHMLE